MHEASRCSLQNTPLYELLPFILRHDVINLPEDTAIIAAPMLRAGTTPIYSLMRYYYVL